jgi:hypothetical protein
VNSRISTPAADDPALGAIRDLLIAAEKIIRRSWKGEPVSANSSDSDETTSVSDGIALTALDRIVQVGIAAVVGARHQIMGEVIQSLVSAFRVAGDKQLHLGDRSPASLTQATRWKEIIVRVFV